MIKTRQYHPYVGKSGRILDLSFKAGHSRGSFFEGPDGLARQVFRSAPTSEGGLAKRLAEAWT
jgi:hypothetical protein